MTREFTHGMSGYNNHKCRCRICKDGVNAYNRQYRRTRQRLGECCVCGKPTEGEAWRCFYHANINALRTREYLQRKRANQETGEQS